MTEKFITFISNDINFDDIGNELFKLAISLTFALTKKRQLAFIEGSYTNIINIFIKYFKYKSLTFEDFEKLHFKEYSLNNYSFDDNLIMIFDNDNNYSHKYISDEVRNLLSVLIIHNNIYKTFIHNKMINIMNYFGDYNLDNYVCMNIKKDIYIPYYYEKAYYTHFINHKAIILTDDIDWLQTNMNFIQKSNVIFLANVPEHRFTNFVLLSSFNNMIIDKNNYSWWIAFLGKKDKKIIIPERNDYYLNEWTNIS